MYGYFIDKSNGKILHKTDSANEKKLYQTFHFNDEDYILTGIGKLSSLDKKLIKTLNLTDNEDCYIYSLEKNEKLPHIEELYIDYNLLVHTIKSTFIKALSEKLFNNIVMINPIFTFSVGFEGFDNYTIIPKHYIENIQSLFKTYGYDISIENQYGSYTKLYCNVKPL